MRKWMPLKQEKRGIFGESTLLRGVHVDFEAPLLIWSFHHDEKPFAVLIK
jgi:hypothetical protein